MKTAALRIYISSKPAKLSPQVEQPEAEEEEEEEAEAEAEEEEEEKVEEKEEAEEEETERPELCEVWNLRFLAHPVVRRLQCW